MLFATNPSDLQRFRATITREMLKNNKDLGQYIVSNVKNRSEQFNKVGGRNF